MGGCSGCASLCSRAWMTRTGAAIKETSSSPKKFRSRIARNYATSGGCVSLFSLQNNITVRSNVFPLRRIFNTDRGLGIRNYTETSQKA